MRGEYRKTAQSFGIKEILCKYNIESGFVSPRYLRLHCVCVQNTLFTIQILNEQIRNSVMILHVPDKHFTIAIADYWNVTHSIGLQYFQLT